jgi:hypothetical protein
MVVVGKSKLCLLLLKSAAEIGPVALTLDAPHPTACLPAIADLTTDRAAICVIATFAPGQIADCI